MNDKQLKEQIEAQEGLCAYEHPGADLEERRLTGEVALGYDNNCIVHLACAKVGTVRFNQSGVVIAKAGRSA